MPEQRSRQPTDEVIAHGASFSHLTMSTTLDKGERDKRKKKKSKETGQETGAFKGARTLCTTSHHSKVTYDLR